MYGLAQTNMQCIINKWTTNIQLINKSRISNKRESWSRGMMVGIGIVAGLQMLSFHPKNIEQLLAPLIESRIS